MKTNNFFKHLPSVFILLGVGLWVNSWCFSSVTNSYEKDLVEDWKRNFEKGIGIMDTGNNQIHLRAQIAIIQRPDDKSILDAMSEFLLLKEKTFRLLDKQLERGDTNITSILMDFQKENETILYDINKRSSIINDRDIEYVLLESSVRKVDFGDDIELFTQTLKQQVNVTTSINLNFLASKIGGLVLCGWWEKSPVLQFESNVLKKGQIASSKIFLSERVNDCELRFFNTEYIIDGRKIEEQDGAVELQKTFSNTIPQSIEVTYQYQMEYFKKRKIATVMDTIKKNFIIYPIE